MRVLNTIGRMLLGAAIFRLMRRSPKWVLIAAAVIGLALMSIGSARAQESCTATNRCERPVAYSLATSEGEADRSCKTIGANNVLRPGTLKLEGPLLSGSQGHYTARFDCNNATGGRVVSGRGHTYYFFDCPTNAPWNPDTGTCGTPNHCETAPNLGNSAWSGYNASSFSICKDGCTYTDVGVGFVQVIDGTEYYRSTDWEASGAQCTNTPTAPAPPDSDGDGTSDGFDPSPNNPGSGGGGGSDGASQPEDGHCGGEGQPACGDPGSGSGNGNTSGGGGNCKSPPSSTGDPILAQIAYQTWATRCAIEGQGTADSGNGNDDKGQPDWTKGDAPPVDQDNTDYVAETTRFGIGLSPDMLDRQNLFGSGSCPVWTFPIYGGRTWSTASLPAWCDLIAPAMRGLVLIMGAFTALGILMGRFGV